jgi:hypothetical protein
MAGRPSGTTKSKQASLMSGLKKAVEFQDENYVFTMIHSGGVKELLIKDCDSDNEILILPEYLWMLKEVVDAEIKSLQRIEPPKAVEQQPEKAAPPSLDDDDHIETAEEIIAKLEKEKSETKAPSAKK